ncbi:WW domain binding protein 4 [Modicella reniformis]|uniref:WW domain binding protein 4 n=1 Tax=Modicella reniformis TaxID=1440133 RepID=A0A9P6IN26_9FUNG|nr:WW domain binding protein 4 [Modicella reniformis]
MYMTWKYWKSNAKFWCRFCKIYITDNKSTRSLHDAGTKHKENVERFLRESNQRSRDKEVETTKMNKQWEAIEKAALEQYQQDVKAGFVQPSSSSQTPTKESGTVTSASSTKAASVSSAGKAGAGAGQTSSVAPSSLEAQVETLTSAASSSSSNSDTAEKDSSETTTKPTVTPRDETVGQPGEWQTVEVSIPKRQGGKEEDGSHYIPGADDDEEREAADPEDLRSFKIEEKTYPVDSDPLGEDGQHNGAEDSGGAAAVFKKRKAGASKPRNIRRKI